MLALNVGAMLLAFIALVAMVNAILGLPSLWHDRSVWSDALAALRAGGHEPSEACAAADLGHDALVGCIHDASTTLHHSYSAWGPFTIQRVLGWLGWPIPFVMGVPAEDCQVVSEILGQRLVLNEFVGYISLADNLGSAHPMGHRAAVICSYALCGFANFSSIAIQLGGIGAMAPDRRKDLARLGLRAMLGGLLSTYMTACVAGMMI
jgi:CNT family concentrative nucleoside transporter